MEGPDGPGQPPEAGEEHGIGRDPEAWRRGEEETHRCHEGRIRGDQEDRGRG
ncbi:hypothetical protein SDC9_186157 [bioreactor metagenome]|uniref:Uncharacterized protein n=1 Tax=bioreactor metagenome TaxID=1076179 RepID=A0A645HTC4_9ZZZZ